MDNPLKVMVESHAPPRPELPKRSLQTRQGLRLAHRGLMVMGIQGSLLGMRYAIDIHAPTGCNW